VPNTKHYIYKYFIVKSITETPKFLFLMIWGFHPPVRPIQTFNFQTYVRFGELLDSKLTSIHITLQGMYQFSTQMIDVPAEGDGGSSPQ
jgi:hypothetical protein